MTCQPVQRELDAYLDGELERESSMIVHDHLTTCDACRRKLADAEAISRLVRAAPCYSAPDRLRARVMA